MNASFGTQMLAIGILCLAGACEQQKPRADSDGGAGDGGSSEDASERGDGSGKGTDEGGAEAGAACGARTSTIAWAMWKMPNPPMDDLPNPASYTDLGDGTVRDNVTCLVWQRDIPEGTYTWAEANDYCASLPLAGGGWSLPSRIELVSLVDFSKASPEPAIDTSAFPDTLAEAFWSSSTVIDSESGWYVNFYTGATSAELPNLDIRVRCVFSGPGRPATADKPNGLYEIESGEVLDTQTGLVWQQVSSASTMSWSEAQAYCKAPWRVPSMKELQTLVDETKLYPAIDTSAFPDVSATFHDYWSSSEVAGLTSYAWFVRFASGYTIYGDQTTEQYRVRCVR